MSHSVDQQMTAIYCFVDEFSKAHPAWAHWRRSPHAQPQFSAAEALTIALRQGVFEVATLTQLYRLVAQKWRAAFPPLPSYKQWLTRLQHVLPQVGCLLATTCTPVPRAARLYLRDSKPIPRWSAHTARARASVAGRRRVLWHNQQGLVLRLQVAPAAPH